MTQIDADGEGLTERARVRALSSQRSPRLCVEMILRMHHQGTKTRRRPEGRT